MPGPVADGRQPGARAALVASAVALVGAAVGSALVDPPAGAVLLTLTPSRGLHGADVVAVVLAAALCGAVV
ncbi:MAG: hypothetical protein ACRD1K_02535, partial [Acidimicrobiales bacterium]